MLAEKLPEPIQKSNRVWTDADSAAVYERYVLKGETAAAVGADIGRSANAVRCHSAEQDWKRDPEFNRRNLTASNKSRAGAVIAFEPVPRRTHALHLAPIVFAAPKLETETLGDRVLRELSAKPMSSCSMATLLGEKENLVELQLGIFAHEGRVVAGPVGERGRRYRIWTFVSPSVAETAASLRCGPDSLVVAGEAV